jgi:hypothetical protein
VWDCNLREIVVDILYDWKFGKNQDLINRDGVIGVSHCIHDTPSNILENNLGVLGGK